jgi:hypothetical protein
MPGGGDYSKRCCMRPARARVDHTLAIMREPMYKTKTLIVRGTKA